MREAAEVAIDEARIPAATVSAPVVEVWFEDRSPRVERALRPSGLLPRIVSSTLDGSGVL